MYSNYQRQKQGLITKTYHKADVLAEQIKIKKILCNFKNYDFRLRRIAVKKLRLYKQNIEFICRMMNQQIIEQY